MDTFLVNDFVGDELAPLKSFMEMTSIMEVLLVFGSWIARTFEPFGLEIQTCWCLVIIPGDDVTICECLVWDPKL